MISSNYSERMTMNRMGYEKPTPQQITNVLHAALEVTS